MNSVRIHELNSLLTNFSVQIHKLFRLFFSLKIQRLNCINYSALIHQTWYMLTAHFTVQTPKYYYFHFKNRIYFSQTLKFLWPVILSLTKVKIHKTFNNPSFHFSQSFKALKMAAHFPQIFKGFQNLPEPWSNNINNNFTKHPFLQELIVLYNY